MLYVLSISQDFVSLIKLDLEGYSFTFYNSKFNLFKNTSFVGFGNLYLVCKNKISNSHVAKSLLTLHHNIGTRCNLINEDSSILSHRCLGHLSEERIKRLVKDGIFPNLGYIDLDVCI